ncbi:unnamed protein product [Phytophthora fragariaefolia]|uniref:Unnamed protein product n=1 Tax=Phytophthora fragariaefolia TaxID=1490495 RepID=A0A9W6U0X0_9STRA|nr:unnamed protein product [Phytophthora fragariaefolia]
MGLEPQTNPSEAALQDWPPAIAGKEQIAVEDEASAQLWNVRHRVKTPPTVRPKGDADPSQIPLPETPNQNEHGKESDDDGLFGVKTGEDDYYRKGDAEYDDPSDELARQVREVSAIEPLNSSPRLELAAHRPPAQIKAFSGLRNKSETSIQWLQIFVYEMKGARTPPNEWYMAFELSLRDGALDWYRQLPRKSKRQWKLLSDVFIKYYCSQSVKARYYSAKREGSEHVCDYLNRLNGYARNAVLQFEKGRRESKEHGNRFLESCGERGLERRLCHLRVKDIHELEDIINDILKSEERSSTRETSAYDRQMDDSRHAPRILLAEASQSEMMAELQVRESKYGRSERAKARDVRQSLEDSSSEDVEDRSRDDDQSGSDYADPYHSDEHDRHVAASNDAECRTEAIGTYGRSENRGRRGDFPNRGLERNSRHQGPDRRSRQYGPCAACGGASHSAHYCSKRCKLGKQVRDAGKCEPFQTMSTYLRTKVDKKDLPVELQSLLFRSDLNLATRQLKVGWSQTGCHCYPPHREEVTEVKTMELEKERNGTFGGGQSHDRRYNEWNGGSSEGLVSSVIKKTGHDYQPKNVIKLL